MTNRTRMDAIRSAERLDDLPDGTVIAWEEFGITIHAAAEDGSWCVIGGDWIRERQNILTWADPGSIRVVSVPVDALLNPKPATVALGRIDPTSEGALAVLRAAIAHATGEASDD